MGKAREMSNFCRWNPRSVCCLEACRLVLTTMKLEGFLLLTLMVFSVYTNVAPEAINTQDYCRGYLQHSCETEKIAHCASDGSVYGNRCQFCDAYFKSGGKITLRHLGRC
ncbi:ovomucoid-like [Elgaria multicarinata webbii]|uniref:ovomucoid-like n=1 Tax=Elgaria multicarinata webbii TaxID=159646 RepID=UPI002FCCD5DD